MNGSNGVQPVVELAGANNGNGYVPYPVMYGNNGGFGNGFSGDAAWIIILFALIFGNGAWGNNGGGFFGGGFDNGYAWLSNGQKDIMTNTNNGFDTLHLSNQLEGTRNSLNDISTQLCNSTASITSAINTTAYNAEIAAANRQMADMQQNFDLSRQFADCCCENRLANCQTQNTIISEAATTRYANANNTRDIIDSSNRNSQAILDKLCQLELDGVKAQVEAKNDRILELQTQLNMANLAASQTAQTAQLRLSEEQQFENFYNRLKNCPVNAVAVYGNTPVFTCPNNNGCGCGYNTTSQFI